MSDPNDAPLPMDDMLNRIWSAVGGPAADLSLVRQGGEGSLPSLFAVSDLAVAAVAAAGLGIAERVMLAGHRPASVEVSRRLASLWFATSFAPEGWKPPPAWDPVAGDYRTRDGWIRLHTNAPHHRDAALAVLGAAADRKAVAAAVANWTASELEQAVVGNKGCAAAMRSREEWAAHPQGVAVAAEPLVWREEGEASRTQEPAIVAARPLRGVKVLDLTRVLAGPVATRFLAGFGAEVLRIDPPFWDEPAVLPDMTLGKRCARLDLRRDDDRARLGALLAEADVMVHGYRADALEALGLGAAWRQAVRPGLVDVSLDAYGWSGPWAQRRGFDSLVQMSSGIAHAGMLHFGTDRPRPLPVQALDHAAGYLLAACALRGLNERARAGKGSCWRTSLARVAALLAAAPPAQDDGPLTLMSEVDYSPVIETTGWGAVRRLRPPLAIEGAPMAWDRPAGPLGRDPAAW